MSLAKKCLEQIERASDFSLSPEERTKSRDEAFRLIKESKGGIHEAERFQIFKDGSVLKTVGMHENGSVDYLVQEDETDGRKK